MIRHKGGGKVPTLVPTWHVRHNIVKDLNRIQSLVWLALSEQFWEFGYNFCVDCLRSSGVYLDCSHTISVDEAQKSRRTELAYDKNNIKVRCRECHQDHDRQSRVK